MTKLFRDKKNKKETAEKTEVEVKKKREPGRVSLFLSKYYGLVIVITALLETIFIEIFGRHSLVRTLEFMVMHPLVFICNVILVGAVLSPAILFRRRAFALCVLSVFPVAVGVINGVILANRMTPFNVKDLSNFKDGLSIVSSYFSVLTVTLSIAGILAFTVLMVLLFRKLPKRESKVNLKKAVIILLIVVLGTSGSIQGAMKIGIVETFFGNLAYAYRDNGVPYSFMVTWLKTGIDKPDKYSAEKMQKIFTGGELGSDGIYDPEEDNTGEGLKANVIFLQLESFIDPTQVKNMEYSKDPVPYFRKLMQNYSSGYLTVPAVGAGTANVEFEAMTGISVKAFGPGEYPYKSIMLETTCETTAYDLAGMGYSAHAIHNHRGAFYGRNKVFPNMGFNTFTSLEYMNRVTKTPKNWAKDGVLTGEITDALKSTKGRDYIYTISVQGHGKYPTEEVLTEPEIKATGAPSEEENWAYEYYVNQVYEMDLFLKDLTKTLSKFDEPVVLVIYGDHLPALDMTEDQMVSGDLYKTQYVIWDNIGLQEQDMDLCTYNISAEVLSRLGISDGLMTKFHQNCRNSKKYVKNMESLGYDLLYGKHYIYGEKLPFEPVDMRMGVNEVKITDVVKIGEKYYIKGENFTEYSKISLGDKVLKTVYLGPTILGLSEEVKEEDVANMKVSQVEKNKQILSTTE